VCLTIKLNAAIVQESDKMALLMGIMANVAAFSNGLAI